MAQLGAFQYIDYMTLRNLCAALGWSWALALATGCGSSTASEPDPLDDAPDMLVAAHSSRVKVELTLAQLDRLLLDSAAWLRMKHPSNQAVFQSVSIAPTTAGAVVTAAAFDYDSVGKLIPLNFELRRESTPSTRTLQLKSTLYYGAIPVMRENKLRVTVAHTAAAVGMTVDATPTWVARSLGGAKVAAVAEDLRDLFGGWIRDEGPKEPK